MWMTCEKKNHHFTIDNVHYLAFFIRMKDQHCIANLVLHFTKIKNLQLGCHERVNMVKLLARLQAYFSDSHIRNTPPVLFRTI